MKRFTFRVTQPLVGFYEGYAYVEANSEEEAKKKAIEDNIWEENPNNILLGYEYIAIKDNKVII